MVSHHHAPAYAASELYSTTSAPVPRTASSVTSGRSQTRRHRHARTHHGASSSAHLPQNEFPVFSQTGDIEIIITSANGRHENRYLLHRLILGQCSGFFEAGTRAEWSGGKAGEGLARINENDSGLGSSSRTSSQERRPSFDQTTRRRWRYVLDWRAVTGSDDAPMLAQQEIPTSLFGGHDEHPPPIRPKPAASSSTFFRSASNFSTLDLSSRAEASGAPYEPGTEILKDYDNLFRTMYQHPPVLDSINIATAYTECKALLHLADMYDALAIAGPRIDHHLLRFGARLFKQIAKYPPSYLKLGYLARSRTIFTEALVHVVGQWPLAAPQLRGNIDASVTELIEDKVDETAEQQERVEAKLWRLTLTTSRGERVTPANDYLAWLAISLFRDWVATNTTVAPPPILKETSTRPGSNHIASQRSSAPAPPVSPSSPGRIYRLLGSTSALAYLTHEDLKRFLKLQPDLYTRDNVRRFERRVDELKNLARALVTGLNRNYLELDLSTFGTGGLGYLTCCKVEERELPWDD